ncbi:hypothetical protein QVD17_02642 [Tagetes erecta]|uniref:Uncharacterized protein n=1 Tax=Tagetes erecta TaxID=13708 RepID=A0AAD8L9M1_TARER|nr:hypothetical protein QVD17_02642 [Tagetes erecta]
MAMYDKYLIDFNKVHRRPPEEKKKRFEIFKETLRLLAIKKRPDMEMNPQLYHDVIARDPSQDSDPEDEEENRG